MAPLDGITVLDLTRVGELTAWSREGEWLRVGASVPYTRLIAELGVKPGDRVADIGANTGLLTVHLARAVSPGGKVIATDIEAGVL